MSNDFEKQMRHYCAMCDATFNCPVGTLKFQTCTHKHIRNEKQPEYKDLIWDGNEFTLQGSTDKATE